MNAVENAKINMPTSSSMVVVPFAITQGGADLRLAINIHKVLQVLDLDHFDPLPSDFLPYIGMINIDSLPVPILDLHQVFHSVQKRPSNDAIEPTLLKNDHRRIVVCHVQNITVGILVDRTRKLEHFHSSKVLPVPEGFNTIQQEINFFSALLYDGEYHTYLLDIESILSHFGLQTAEEEYGNVSSMKHKGKTILVVEDAPFFLKRSVKILTNHGADVVTARDGEEGLKILSERQDIFDLIFTDIEMPIMNGIQMIIEFNKIATKKIPVLFNSAISNPVLIDELKQQKLGDYIVKFDEKIINQKLDELFNV